MRIVIDLQACQSSGSRTRGIGRYSLALAQAMARNAGQHEIWLLLSGLFPETIQPLRAAFAGLVPPERIRVWEAPAPVRACDPANDWRRQAAELVREQALAELRPDMVHVTSLFEGHVDDAVTSVGAASDPLPTAVTLYDLIPLVYADHYLADAGARGWYHRKLAALKQADLLLSISAATRDEGLAWLNMEADRIVNISSAVDDRFFPQQPAAEQMAAIRAQYGLTRRFVMYTGGIDHRKNIEGLIRAFAALPAALRASYQLAVVCSIRPTDVDRLQDLARSAGLARDEVVLTGFVPDEVLPLLYNDCALFVFPSWHEGFGLPALEAMACGAPVIAANNSSLPEVIGREDALFDPRDDRAITAKMQLALEQPAYAASLKAHALEQAKKFSWDASGIAALQAFEAFHARRQAQQAIVAQAADAHLPQAKPLLAFVSPLPPLHSGIADFSASLVTELARYYQIELVVAQDNVEGAELTACFPLRDWRWFTAHAARYDRVLYHFGNSDFHSHMFPLLEQHPGVVVMHDFYMSGVLAYGELRGLPGYWTEALYASHGYQALRARRDAANEADVVMAYPCNKAVLDLADGVIVHSEFARKLAQRWYGPAAADGIVTSPLLRKLPPQRDRAEIRKRLGFTEDDVLVCTYGMIASTKMNRELLDAWLASPLAADRNSYLVFVGQTDGGPYGLALQKAIPADETGQRIRITGFADAALFNDYLAAADISVQLRTKSRGETSAAVLDCMAHGTPTIVNAHAAMNELPDHAVLKLADGFKPQELTDALVKLRTDVPLRHRLGRAARDYIAAHHSPAVVLERYCDAIEAFSTDSLPARRRRVANAIGMLATRVEPSMDDLMGIATGLASCAGRIGPRQLLVDITGQEDSDQAANAALIAALVQPPAGWRIEPVRFDKSMLRYARAAAFRLLDLHEQPLEDAVVDAANGDVLATADAGASYARALADRGVQVHASLQECLASIVGVKT